MLNYNRKLGIYLLILACLAVAMIWMKDDFGSIDSVTVELPSSESQTKAVTTYNSTRPDTDPPPCGEICSYSTHDSTQSTIDKYPQLRKAVECENILGRMAWDHYEVLSVPPRRPPPQLLGNFTQNGEAPVSETAYYNNVYKSKKRTFTAKAIQNLMDRDLSGKVISTYKTKGVFSRTIKNYSHVIEGKDGLVIGTLDPWVEAILLNAGANKLTTLEYGELEFEHPNMSALHPVKMAKLFQAGKADLVDFAASYSSIEHSGLGRYGDPINPYGDFEAVAQVWCMMKPGGVFFLAVPFSEDGSSSIVWNAHRMYGPARLQHLTANWDVIDVRQCHDAYHHGILVLRKI